MRIWKFAICCVLGFGIAMLLDYSLRPVMASYNTPLGFNSLTGAANSTQGSYRFSDSGVPANFGVYTDVITTPGAPTVTVNGVSGATTYGYKVCWLTPVGCSVQSSQTTVNTGNSALSVGNFNNINPGACPTPVSQYRIYRTTAGGTGASSTTGLIPSLGTCGSPFSDTGFTADGTDSFFILTDSTRGTFFGKNVTMRPDGDVATPFFYAGNQLQDYAAGVVNNIILGAAFAFGYHGTSNQRFYGLSLLMDTTDIGQFGSQSASYTSGGGEPTGTAASAGYSGSGTLPAATAISGTIDLNIGAAAGTITFARNFRGTTPFGSSTAMTNFAHYYADDVGQAIAANYGYYSLMNAAANKWAFYGAGTANNHFGGSTEMVGGVSSYQNIATSGPGLTPVYGTVSSTANTAPISTSTLCAAANCKVGEYIIKIYVASTVTCAVPGPANMAVTLTWTDDAGTKTAQVIPLIDNSAVNLSASMALGNTTNYAYGSAALFSTGVNPIQYSTTYTACTVGTGTYSLRISAIQTI